MNSVTNFSLSSSTGDLLIYFAIAIILGSILWALSSKIDWDDKYSSTRNNQPRTLRDLVNMWVILTPIVVEGSRALSTFMIESQDSEIVSYVLISFFHLLITRRGRWITVTTSPIIIYSWYNELVLTAVFLAFLSEISKPVLSAAGRRIDEFTNTGVKIPYYTTVYGRHSRAKPFLKSLDVGDYILLEPYGNSNTSIPFRVSDVETPIFRKYPFFQTFPTMVSAINTRYNSELSIFVENGRMKVEYNNKFGNEIAEEYSISSISEYEATMYDILEKDEVELTTTCGKEFSGSVLNKDSSKYVEIIHSKDAMVEVVKDEGSFLVLEHHNDYTQEYNLETLNIVS